MELSLPKSDFLITASKRWIYMSRLLAVKTDLYKTNINKSITL
jgi:hypothetical protein